MCSVCGFFVEEKKGAGAGESGFPRAEEKRALMYGLKEIGIDMGTIITDAEKRLEQSVKFKLNIIPVWEWLLFS